MLRMAIDKLDHCMNWMRRSQRVTPKTNPVKVNVGSSLFVADGWINVDGSTHVNFCKAPAFVLKFLYRFSNVEEWFGREEDYLRVLKTHTFVPHNLEYGLPFWDDSVDYLYSSHVIEHFYRKGAEQILREAYRVLKKGGRARICVPDLEYAIRLYTSGEKEKALEYFFIDSAAGTFYRHRYMYDFELLNALLSKIGFTVIERHGYREGKVPDINKLDNRPEETLYVEVVK